MNKKGSGYLYVATGDKYIREAETAAQSLLAASPSANICLVTDHQIQSVVFDNIRVVSFESIKASNWKANLVYKIIGIQNSPFERTIFLDTDTKIIHSIDDLFQMLDYFDAMCCLDYYDKSIVNIASSMKVYTPYNTGMLVFKASKKTDQLLLDWQKHYEDNIEKYWSDQPAFTHALLFNDIKMYILHGNYNFRFLNNVGLLEKEPVKMIHGRATEEDFKIIEERVNHTLSQRVWVASLRKTYSWSSELHSRLVRKVYSNLPNVVQRLFRRYFK